FQLGFDGNCVAHPGGISHIPLKVRWFTFVKNSSCPRHNFQTDGGYAYSNNVSFPDTMWSVGICACSREALMKKRILVVDDDAGIRDLLNACLIGLGYEVILCENGQQCLRQVILRRPDAIVLDVKLPDMNGSNLLDCIRVTKLTK